MGVTAAPGVVSSWTQTDHFPLSRVDNYVGLDINMHYFVPCTYAITFLIHNFAKSAAAMCLMLSYVHYEQTYLISL
jgi:hypothetical protein